MKVKSLQSTEENQIASNQKIPVKLKILPLSDLENLQLIGIFMQKIPEIVNKHLKILSKCSQSYHDMVLDPELCQLITATKKLKDLPQAIGKIWQESFGLCSGIIDLGKNHKTGLDIMSTTNHPIKFALELKNRYNTDNYKSRHKNYDTLVKFKKNNPDYSVIYGFINCENPHNEGTDRNITHDGIQIRLLSGYKLLTFIFGQNTLLIIDLIKTEISKHKYMF